MVSNPPNEFVAGNGLLSRRRLLGGVAGVAGAAMISPAFGNEPKQAMELWRQQSGLPASAYGDPARRLQREQLNLHPFGAAAGSSSTPLQHLNGTLTPNSLHFERHHSGIPDIDPAQHSLTVFGDVERALTFSYESLLRYPLVSRTWFLECSGNSFRNTLGQPADMTAGELNGLISCAEWTGIPLGVLLEECGLKPSATWLVAEGADAAGMNRSVPLSLAMDNALVALYQNGEPLRPAQGYPVRLLVPGCEGNISIKWLRSIKLTDEPAHTREETSKYTDLYRNGHAEQFSLRMEVKSVITSPSGKMTLPENGVYQVSGLAWSGGGGIRRVEVSADGGNSWAEADIQSEPGEFRPVRFRIPWQWSGQPAVLMSRATDTQGQVQPTRAPALQGVAPGFSYHYNGMQSWQVDEQGRVRNVYV